MEVCDTAPGWQLTALHCQSARANLGHDGTGPRGPWPFPSCPRRDVAPCVVRFREDSTILLKVQCHVVSWKLQWCQPPNQLLAGQEPAASHLSHVVPLKGSVRRLMDGQTGSGSLPATESRASQSTTLSGCASLPQVPGVESHERTDIWITLLPPWPVQPVHHMFPSSVSLL